MALAIVQLELDGINQEYLAEWLLYREEDCKKKMTPRAIKMLQKKLIQYSIPEQERLICNSIEMNWQGVYWTDPPRQDTSRSRSLEADLTDRSWAT